MTAEIKAEDGHDIHIVRIINAPRETVWRCWAEEALLQEWFCPRPWKVSDADFKNTPGGRRNMVMNGPDGERVPMQGILLAIDPGKSMTFTDAYTEGFIPAADHFMTGYVQLDDTPDGKTKMIWGARHPTREKAEQHLQMGFEQGWNAAADQLDELAQSLSI